MAWQRSRVRPPPSPPTAHICAVRGRVAQLAEHLYDTQVVEGSIPSPPTGQLAQWQEHLDHTQAVEGSSPPLPTWA